MARSNVTPKAQRVEEMVVEAVMDKCWHIRFAASASPSTVYHARGARRKTYVRNGDLHVDLCGAGRPVVLTSCAADRTSAIFAAI